VRILAGFIHYEASTFSPLIVNYEDFEVVPAKDALDFRLGISGALLQGIVAELRSHAVEIMPTNSYDCVPGGLVSKAAYARIRSEFLGQVRRAKDIDGVCLGLHGSDWAEGPKELVHVDGDIVAGIREILGPDVPIVVGMDLHGTLSQQLLKNASGLMYYRTAPHADQFQTGQRTAKLLLQILEDGVKPVMAYTKLPLIVSGEQAMTVYEPMLSAFKMLEEVDAMPGILSCSIAVGNYWTDVAETGVTALVVSDGDKKLAKAQADRLASAIWKRRDELRFVIPAYPIDGAIDAALAEKSMPIFLSDQGDNSTGGGATDVPTVIERLKAKKVKNAAVAAIHDPAALEACVKAGVGAKLTLSIGGKVDKTNRKPLRVTGRVKLLSDGEFYQLGQRREGMRASMGRVAVFDIDGIDVMLTEKRIAVIDPAQLRSVGIEPTEYKIVVVKLGYIWPALRPVAAKEILMISSGATDMDFRRLGYKRVRRPIHPFDPGLKWKPGIDR
jgi:microcystin degradation protein MlrC